MKLKRILAGITACTIVGSTILTMPISAKTTTKAEEVTLSDLLNTAKMAADLKDDLTAEKQAEILDKFDTNGNGQISISELLAVAQRVARTDESDIVNEYGTGDEAPFNPTFTIGGKEYKDGDKFNAKANEIYEIGVSDGENELTVSLTGSKDDENNDLVRVDGNRFEVIKDGKLTITVKTADGQEKTITLNVVTEKSLEDIDLNTLYISYLYEGRNYYSDDYKKFSNEIGKDIFNNGTEIKDSEQYWKDKAQDFSHEKISGGKICTGIGGKVEIKGLAIGNDNRRLIRGAGSQNSYEDYNTSDKITYISTDTNKVTIDENGVITGLVSGTVEIIVMVNGKEYSRFNVFVRKGTYAEIEASGEKYAFDYYCNYSYPYQYTLLTEGKYVENASQGKALSLKDLQNQVGAENVKSVSVKNFDGTEREIAEVTDESGVMYYADTTTSTVYYAITSETGEGSFKVNVGDRMSVDVRVLDMEQYKNYQATLPESLIFEFRDRKVVATAESKPATYLNTFYFAQGETFKLSDIVRVNGVDDPKITVTNSQNGTPAQNIDYDPLTKTFTARELTEENEGVNNEEVITLTYTASDGTTREIKFEAIVCKPIVGFEPRNFGYVNGYIHPATYGTYTDMNGEKIYLSKNMLDEWSKRYILEIIRSSVTLSYTIGKNDVYQIFADKGENWICIAPNGRMCKLAVDNEKMFKVNNNSYINIIAWADGYEAKAGDTVTITATDIQNNPNFKTSFTIEVVDELPKAVKSGMGTDKFEYPKDNKAHQYITFDNIVDADNLPEECTLVPYVESASENVGYIDEKGEKQQTSSSTMTVDTTGMKIVKGSNGHYSISGIEVASASRVDFDTFMNVKVKVLDGKGNTITISDPIELSVKGEQGMAMTIDGTTKTIKAGETTDFGTIYIKEGESINFSASEMSADALSVSEIDSATVDKNKGTITAKELTSAISEGNTDGKEITFTYGTGSGVITAKAKIVVVKTKIMAYYAPAGRTVEITDGETFWSADGNKIEAGFITEVDNYGKEKAGESVGKYEIKDGKVVFTYSKDSKITASCPVKKAEITAGEYSGDHMQVDKNVKEVTFPVAVSTGLSFESGELQYDKNIITVGSKVDTSGAIIFSGIDASKIHVNTAIGSISFVINAKDKNGIVVARKTCELNFTETLFQLKINGKIAEADSSTPKAITDTIYVQEGKEINYNVDCLDLNGDDDKNATKTATSDNTSLVTVGDGKIKAGTLTGAKTNNTTITFNCKADTGQERTITANVVVVKPVAVAPAYIGDGGYINVTDDVYCTADINKKKAIPAFATKVDANGKPILNDESLITKGFEGDVATASNESPETSTIWKQQGIRVTVKNATIDPSNEANLFKANTNKRYTVIDNGNVKTLTFENPWEKCDGYFPDGWSSIDVVNADSNSEWTPKFTNVSTVECTRTGNTALGDTTTLNLTAELRDKNGNLVKQDTQTLNAYINPQITVEQIFNSENKDFTYKVNLDVSGWKVADAYISGIEYSGAFNEATEEITIKYNTAIDKETKGTVMVANINKDGGVITKYVEFTATPVRVAPIFILKAIDEVNKTVTYRYTSSETFDGVIVPTGAGYTATIDTDKKTVTVKFADKITDNVNLTFKNDKMEITKTLSTAFSSEKPNIDVNLSRNVDNQNLSFEYKALNSSWFLNSVESMTEDCNIDKSGSDTMGMGTLAMYFEKEITSERKVKVKYTFKSTNGLTYTMAEEYDITPVTVDFTENGFVQETNIANTEIKYLTNIPVGWTISQSVASEDESKYTASYNEGILTVKAVEGATIGDNVTLTFTLGKDTTILRKKVTIPVSKIDSFPQIKLSENTASDVSGNTEFFYTISNSGELSRWTIRKEEEPQKYDIDFISDKSAFKLFFTSAITETQENMAIKYKLQKTEGFITYISPEYTLNVTATYTAPTTNP